MLKGEAVKGIKWTGLSTLIIGVLGPVFLFIQSLFFSPFEFGILSLVVVVIAILRVLEDAGIGQSIIQRNANSDEISSLLFFNLIANFILSLAIMISSSIFARLFDYPDFAGFMILIGFNTLFSGGLMIFKASLQKDMLFKEISTIEIIRRVFMVLSSTAFFIFGFGIVGYIYGLLASNILACLLYIYYTYKKTKLRVSFRMKLGEIVPFLRFAVFIALKNIVAEITHNIDKVIIGIFLSKEVLGLYSYAKQLLDQVRVLITTSFSSVLFSLFSHFKSNLSQLRIMFIRITKYVIMISLPMFLGVILVIDRASPIVLGNNWEGIEIYFKLLAFPMFLLSMTAGISNPVLYSLGNSRTSFIIDLISSGLYVLLLFLFSSKGTITVCIIYCIYIVIKVFLLQVSSSRALKMGILEYYYEAFKKVLIPNIFMILSYMLLSELFIRNNVTILVILVSVCIITYSLCSVLLNRKDTLEMLKLGLQR